MLRTILLSMGAGAMTFFLLTEVLSRLATWSAKRRLRLEREQMEAAAWLLGEMEQAIQRARWAAILNGDRDPQQVEVVILARDEATPEVREIARRLEKAGDRIRARMRSQPPGATGNDC